MTTGRTSEVWTILSVLGVGYVAVRTAGVRPTWPMLWLAAAVLLWFAAVLIGPGRWGRLAFAAGLVLFLVWHLIDMATARPRFVPVVTWGW